MECEQFLFDYFHEGEVIVIEFGLPALEGAVVS